MDCSIGKAATETGCHIETIRYYEREGLIPPPRRSSGGHRLYGTATLERLKFIRRCRELGFAMAEIRQLMQIVDRDQVTCEKVKRIADGHIAEITRKIDDLARMKQTLETLSSQCSGDDVPECPIIETMWN